MNRRISLFAGRRSIILLAIASSLPGQTHGGEGPDGESSSGSWAKSVIPQGPDLGTRWGIGGTKIFGLRTQFSGFGSYRPAFSLQPLGGGQDYRYEDGFVLVDASGNAGGLTSNWGHRFDTQYDPSGGGSLDFNLSEGLATGAESFSSESDLGIELSFERDMGFLGRIGWLKPGSRWGFRGSFNYFQVDDSSSNRLFSDLSRTTDSFALNGVIPPLAPFNGSFSGPNALLGDSPLRSDTIVNQGLLVDGSRSLNVDFFTLGLSVYLDHEVAHRFMIGAEAGVLVGLASGDYRFSSLTTLPGIGTDTRSGSNSDTDFLYGAFVGLRASYLLNDDWFLQGGVRYQAISDFEIEAAGTKAELDFDAPVQFTLGFGLSF